MKLHLLTTLTFLLTGICLSAQSTCNCSENLKKTIEKTEEKYAGYPAKVNAASRPGYQSLVTSLQRQAAGETSSKRCYYIISQYVRFFKDKHFILSYYNEQDFDSSVVRFSRRNLEQKFSKKALEPVEGIWMSPDSTTTIAIQKNNTGNFEAIKISSSQDSFPTGFVYFTLKPSKGQFIVKPYNAFVSTSTPAKQRGNLLQIWSQAMWGKVYPQQMTMDEKEELKTWQNNNRGLTFRKINEQTAYLKVPTFFNNDDAIQRLVSKNDSLIRHSKYLVIDIAGNGGGNTGWVNFLPYLMTNMIRQPSAMLRVTPDNVKMKMPELEYFVKNPVTDEYKKYFPDSILNTYKQAYAELPDTKEKFYPIPAVIFPLDSILKYPAKVALVMDNFCGSSAEFFIHLSKQSSKITRYGTNSIGMMDYEGMSTPTPLPCKSLILTIPIAKSGWTDSAPIDATGMKPDIQLIIPQNKWLEFIEKDLQKR